MSNLKPILFNTAMVQAILDGRKTTTRRIIKVDSKLNFIGFGVEPKEIKNTATFGHGSFEDVVNCKVENHIKAPYLPGDILYVRETFAKICDVCEKECIGCNKKYAYKADNNHTEEDKWKPSIHMPKEAARIFLKVTDVRVERLQDIDYEGCKNEGVKAGYDGWLGEWSSLWDSTVNKKDIDKYRWKANPYVWVIEFLKIDKSDIGMVK